MNYKYLLQDTINEHLSNPIDMLALGDAVGELGYMNSIMKSYVRTVKDIDQLLGSDKKKRILEIGSYLGAVSISLKKLGYDVFAQDIPEFHKSKNLRALYEKYEIPFEAVNLRRCRLPYEDDSFDAVIICEVMEHLNFNPLPVLQEINRVTKGGGYLYMGMPNQASIRNRFRLLIGKSIYTPISANFAQLAKIGNMIVGIHWREYTLGETIEMIEKMGWSTEKAYYDMLGYTKMLGIKSLIEAVLCIVPSFRQAQVVIGLKQERPRYEFWQLDVNS